MTLGVESVLGRSIRKEGRSLLLYLVASTLLYTSSISLVAVSIVLISRSSFRPQILTLGVFIAATQYFAIGRSASRYLERVSSHRLVLASTRSLRLSIFEAARGLFPTEVNNLNRQMIVSGATRGIDSATSLFLRLYLPMVQMGIVALFVLVVGLFFDPIASVLIVGLLGAITLFAYVSSRGTMSRAAIRHSESLSNFESSISELALASEALYCAGVIDGAKSRVGREIVEHSKVESTFERRSFIASIAVTSASQFAFVVATWSSSFRVQAHSLAATSFGVSAMIATGAFEVASSLMVFGATSARPRREVLEVDDLMLRGRSGLDKVGEGDSVEFGEAAAGIDRISVRGVAYQFDDGRRVGPFDLELKRGKSYLILGESGVGKSTLAYLIAGFILPNSGAVEVKSTDGSELQDPFHRISFQGEEVDVFNTSLRSNLMIANENVSDSEMAEVICRVGLSYLLEESGLDLQLGQYGRQLSGGEARRLAVARSILAGSDVAIFDEPTSGVDGDMSQQIVSEIEKLSEDDTIVIVISHEVSLAPLFDEVITLE